MRLVPHPIPYQGSKRRLAKAILSHAEGTRYARLVEPFAGSAAVTLAAARYGKFERFLLADRLWPLVALWNRILEDPEQIAAEYTHLWLRERADPINEYYEIRAEFNREPDPIRLLYLLARCVKNAVRFNPAGEFNQAPDKRRTGTRPETMRKELIAAHRLLNGKAEAIHVDFLDVFRRAEPGDLFYLDPPYQGTSGRRDGRYISGLTRERIMEGLGMLSQRGIPFILSYDGSCGGRTYGSCIPREFAARVLLDVGRSSQATLNGDKHTTIESLYISHGLVPAVAEDRVMRLVEFEPKTTAGTAFSSVVDRQPFAALVPANPPEGLDFLARPTRRPLARSKHSR